MRDLYERLHLPLEVLGVSLAMKSGDTGPLTRLPTVLVTTPESTDSLLTRSARAAIMFAVCSTVSRPSVATTSIVTNLNQFRAMVSLADGNDLAAAGIHRGFFGKSAVKQTVLAAYDVGQFEGLYREAELLPALGELAGRLRAFS